MARAEGAGPVMNIVPAGDGWRVLTDCGGRCGAPVVCLPAAIGTALCITCGRAKHGASVPRRPAPGETRRNGYALGQPGTSMPGRLDPDRLGVSWAGALKSGKATMTRGLVEEWAAGDPRMPSGARGVLAALNGRGRVAHTVALGAGGEFSESVGVHVPRRLAVIFTKRDVAAVPEKIFPGKVNLGRTPTGRRRMVRFGPDGNVAPVVVRARPATVDWPGVALVRQGRALRQMNVTTALQMLRDGELL